MSSYIRGLFKSHIIVQYFLQLDDSKPYLKVVGPPIKAAYTLNGRILSVNSTKEIVSAFTTL